MLKIRTRAPLKNTSHPYWQWGPELLWEWEQFISGSQSDNIFLKFEQYTFWIQEAMLKVKARAPPKWTAAFLTNKVLKSFDDNSWVHIKGASMTSFSRRTKSSKQQQHLGEPTRLPFQVSFLCWQQSSGGLSTCSTTLIQFSWCLSWPSVFNP